MAKQVLKIAKPESVNLKSSESKRLPKIRRAGIITVPRTLCFFSVPAVCKWQMAMASASEASIGSGASAKPSNRVTICCTCCFSARP